MEETLQEILDRAENLFIEYGFRSVSMDDLAHETGKSKKTLYKHFPNKDELVKQILLRFVKRHEARLTEIQQEADNAVDEWFRIYLHHCKISNHLRPSVLYDLEKYHAGAWKVFHGFKNLFIHRVVSENLKRGQAEGLYRQDLDPDIVARMYVAMLEAIVDSGLARKTGMDRQVVQKTFLEYHLYGIATEKGIEIYQRIKSLTDDK